MKNKLIALLVLIVAAGAGYYFLFTKKGSATIADLAALTAAQISNLTDAQISAITSTQKATLTTDQKTALVTRENQIATIAANVLAASRQTAAEAAIAAQKEQEAALLAGNLALAELKRQQALTAQIEADRLLAEKKAADKLKADKLVADQQAELDRVEELKTLAKKVTLEAISEFTKVQIDNRMALPEAPYYSAAQKVAFTNRMAALKEEDRVTAIESKMAGYTKEIIDGLSLKDLKKFTDEELKILQSISMGAYDEYRIDKDKLQLAETFDTNAANFKLGLSKITQAEKDYLYSVAVDVHSDIFDGWFGGTHTWAYYSQIFVLSDILFYYFINYTWFQVDNWQLVTRMKDENYSVISKWNKNNGKTAQDNEIITGAVIDRAEKFPYQP